MWEKVANVTGRSAVVILQLYSLSCAKSYIGAGRMDSKMKRIFILVR